MGRQDREDLFMAISIFMFLLFVLMPELALFIIIIAIIVFFVIPFIRYLLRKKYSEIETTTILSKSPNIIQILDPSDYSAVDLEMKEEFSNYNIGEEIKLIKIDNYIYLLN